MIDYERKELERIIDEYNIKTVFEIGTYKGETTFLLSKKCSMVYTIDIVQHVPNIVYPKNVYDIVYDSIKFNFDEYKNKIDLVFIDGNHHRKYVKKDTRNAYMMVRNQGFIIWHDYDICKPEIIRIVNSFSKEHHCKVNHPIGTKLAICRINDKG